MEALSGCCMMVRRDILNKLGGFDADYFMYGEDLDLCWRLHQAGYRLRYTPATSIVHFKGESTRRSRFQADRHQRRAMRLFVDKNLAGSESWPVRGTLALGFALHAAGHRIGLSKQRGDDNSTFARETQGSQADSPEIKDMVELERLNHPGGLRRAVISTERVTYDQIIELMRNWQRQGVDFAIAPIEREGDEFPKFRIELSHN